MNAQQSTYPAHQQVANLWTPLLAAVLLAIALIVGAAGILAVTAKSGTTSPVFVPQSINSHEHAAAPTLLGVPFPGGLAGPSQLDRSLGTPPGYITMNGLDEGVTTTAPFVPFSINSHDRFTSPTYLGVPYPGGVAGPSQLDRLHTPGMGGR